MTIAVAPGTGFLEQMGSRKVLWCNRCKHIVCGLAGMSPDRAIMIKPRGAEPLIACKKCFVLDLDERDLGYAKDKPQLLLKGATDCVEEGIARYCARFRHVGCGGVPYAFAGDGIVCQKCGLLQEWVGTLRDSLAHHNWFEISTHIQEKGEADDSIEGECREVEATE